MFSIEVAKPGDIETIMQIFESCTKALIEAGIDQWDGSYPTSEMFETNIENQCVVVIKEAEKILATITLNAQQDEQYDQIKWKFLSKKPLIIHRLAVSPDAQGRGLGRILCEFAEDYGIKNGHDVIRLDAYSGNPISCRLYEKLSYHKAKGLCWFHGNKLPFYCYEKELSTNK